MGANENTGTIRGTVNTSCQIILHVYKGTFLDTAFEAKTPSEYKNRYCSSIITDKNGKYEAQLNTGRYTIFICDGKTYYLNDFDKDHYKHIKVTPKCDITYDIKL